MVFKTFQISKGIPRDVTAVLLAQPEGKLEQHPLVRSFSAGDREYLAIAYKSFDPRAHSHRLIVLPSGTKVLIVSAGEKEKFTHRRAILAVRHVIAAARTERVSYLAVNLEDFETKQLSGENLAELFAAQAMLANFEFSKYKEPPKQGRVFVESVLVCSKVSPQAISCALERGAVIGEEVNQSRTLANTPGGDMTPAKLATAAVATGKNAGFEVRVLQEKEMRTLGMGGILGVAKGSSEKPRFIVMEYFAGKKADKPIVLVGKGVTFDTGGLNLKPEQGIYEMHMDMSGGAAVIHALAALARLGVKKNIVALVPAVENATSGSSYRPGDLLKSMSGKTIEVLNTDAEGRVILADAITYAREIYNPELIIDVATLTGAAMVALGQRASAIFTTNPELEKSLCESGERMGDYVWPLPLWDEYEADIQGTFGDVANIGKTRYGGAITSAMFLWQFVKCEPGNAKRVSTKSKKEIPAWAHIDIAPRMTSIEGEWLAKGSAGAPILLLTDFLRNSR